MACHESELFTNVFISDYIYQPGALILKLALLLRRATSLKN